MHMTVGNGLRWSTRRGYLQPVMRRANLTVLTGAHAAVSNLTSAGCRDSLQP